MRRVAISLFPFATVLTSSSVVYFSSSNNYSSATFAPNTDSQSQPTSVNMLSRTVDRIRGHARRDQHPSFSTTSATATTTTYLDEQISADPISQPKLSTDPIITTDTNETKTDLDNMIPITSEMLAEIYANYPTPKPSQELINLRIQLAKTRINYLTLISNNDTPTPNHSSSKFPDIHKTVNDIVNEQPPAGLDSSMYSLRCACEEAAEKCHINSQLTGLAESFEKIAFTFESFQSSQREHVSTLINRFLPQDFRSSMFNMARQRSENSNARALEELKKNGGTTRDKYKLLWEQQWKRRESLAAVGNSSGIWKLVVRYLAGVPEPLLAFAREINSKNGPTDALRIKFSPALVEMTRFAIEMNALCTILNHTNNVDYKTVIAQLEHAQNTLQAEANDFVKQIQVVLTASPFFVHPGDVPQQR